MADVYDSFESMNLNPLLLKGIYAYGYKTPSQVQKRLIVPLSNGRDAIIQAKIEPGKTAAYCSGILQQINFSLLNCQCLILAPNPVAVAEIASDMCALGSFLDVRVHVCGIEDHRLSYSGVHVVVGTRDRVLRLVEDVKPCFHAMKIFVLDEADSMLRADYMVKEVVDDIFGYVRKQAKAQNQIQINLFSEIMPTKMVDTIKVRMKDPLIVLAKNKDEELTLECIKRHQVMDVLDADSKPKAVCDLFAFANNVGPAIVIVHNPQELAYVTEEMKRNGLQFSATKTGMNQKDRDMIARDFLQSGVLITTSRWAKGIRFLRQVELVVITQMCYRQEYLRLMGWFRDVSALVFATYNEWVALIDIQETYNIIFEKFRFGRPPCLRPKWECEARKLKHIKHVVYNSRDKDGKFAALTGFLHEVITAAGFCVIFVIDANKINSLVELMEVKDGYKVVTTNAAFMELLHARDTITDSIVFITTGSGEKVRVPLVIFYDLDFDFECYNRRISWCANTGVVVHLAAKEDWSMVFEIQSWYNVIHTLFPIDILEHFRPAHRILNRQRLRVEPTV